MRSNREYDYFGNVLEYDYFPSYSSTQKVLVLKYEYKYTSTITPSLHGVKYIEMYLNTNTLESISNFFF